MKKAKTKAKPARPVIAAPPRSFNDTARLAARVGSSRPAPRRSEWSADPKLSALKKALEGGREEEAVELLEAVGGSLKGSMLANAFGCAMWTGSKLTARKLLALGARPGDLALEDGELEWLSATQTASWEAPINMALRRGHFQLARWLVADKGPEAFGSSRLAATPFFAVATGSRGSPSERAPALEWALERGPEPSEREVGLIALAGRFDALEALWAKAAPHRLPALARASLSGLASICADSGEGGRMALEALERAIGLCEGKCERGLGVWDPRDAEPLTRRLAEVSEGAKRLSEKVERQVGWADPRRLGWPRLCALMCESRAAFEALEALPASGREIKELSEWESLARAAVEGKAIWGASLELVAPSVDYRWSPDPRSSAKFMEKIDQVAAWLERHAMEKSAKEGGQLRKERAKKSARAARREAERALLAGEIQELPAAPAPAPRRNRL